MCYVFVVYEDRLDLGELQLLEAEQVVLGDYCLYCDVVVCMVYVVLCVASYVIAVLGEIVTVLQNRPYIA